LNFIAMKAVRLAISVCFSCSYFSHPYIVSFRSRISPSRIWAS
jgi:hypothetical protein